MAKGRMLSKSISQSKKFAALASDTHRLVYLLILPHVDVEGRFEADPQLLRGLCFTRLEYDDRTIAEALQDLHDTGLIQLYDVAGSRYLQLADFHRHNKVRKDREGESAIPAPPEIEARAGARPAPGALQEDARPSQSPSQSPREGKPARILKARFGKLYDVLLDEEPKRRAWETLPPERLERALAAAKVPAADDSRGFRTRLKDELDKAIDLKLGLAASGPPDAATARAQRRREERATRASEEAYDAALARGEAEPDAERAAARAYIAALAQQEREIGRAHV